MRWQLDHGVEVAYSTAADGDQRQPDRREAFVRPLIGDRRLVVPYQVHGIEIAIIDEEPVAAQILARADGVVGRDPCLALAAYGADCPGVVIVAPDALGIAHCGWRGTAGGMVERLATALATQTTAPPATWQALIGPGIGGASYEVDQPVLAARSWPDSALTASPLPSRACLHLAIALDHDLHALGITRIVQADVCTAEDARLHSFRRQGAGLVQLLVAWRRDSGAVPGRQDS